jgi:DNA modification methylase
MTTTLWDFPAQQYGDETQGDREYRGATPAHVIWNLLQRYTTPGETVLDPMVGSGTALDVARELDRRGIGFDLVANRPDVTLGDARHLPLAGASADFVFVDPPYSTHIRYSDDPRCIGNLDAAGPAYLQAMAEVVAEIDRVLRPGRHMALYVCDSSVKGQPLRPIGFDLFGLLRRRFEPVDIVAVVRRNRTLLRARWHEEALAGGYLLRGFNYLFIMRKPGPAQTPPRPRRKKIDRRRRGPHRSHRRR